MKKTISPLSSVLAFLALCLIAGNSVAEQSKDIGDAVVYYNAVTTDFFDPNIARLYGIKRSKNRALLTVTVLEKRMGVASKTIKAAIEELKQDSNKQVAKAASEGEAIKDADEYYELRK